MRELAVVDFETEAIDDLNYPPKPVGVAISLPGVKPEYYAWAHAMGNSCTRANAVARLRDVYETYDVCYHNAQFDIDVGETHLKLRPKRTIHDTLILGFLDNPHAPSLELKVISEVLLGIAPKERDKLRDWIIANVPGAKRRPTQWGAFISQAPGDMVAPYARGDVTRPRRLFKHFSKTVLSDRVTDESGAMFSMVDAYQREIRMIDVALKMQRRGVAVARARLARDMRAWARETSELEAEARRILNRPTLELSKSAQLIEALEASGKVSHWIITAPSKRFPKGQKSVGWRELSETLTDRKLYAVIRRHTQISHYITTFATPWLERSERDGRVHPIWSCTRKDSAKGGARSGRLVSNPNWQNVPDPAQREGDDTDLPMLRRYVVPAEGSAFISRDYIQQEFRILAHFEGGALYAMYRKNPLIDVHTAAVEFVSALINRTVSRRAIKGLGFGILYGQGLRRTADVMETDLETAKLIKTAYSQFIQIKDLQDDLKSLARKKKPMRTWGGRLYYCEPPKVFKGRWMSFEYRMINYLVQPSASDCTKTAMINADDLGVELILSIHDDLVAEVPTNKVPTRMAQLRSAMESVPISVAMPTTSKSSKKSWGDLKEYV